MESKYVIIIQCEIAHNRCSGFACTNAFYEKTGFFKNYGEDVKYISFTCGGCCGKSVAAKLEHFTKKLLKKTELKREDVMVHLSSCMVTDNYHYDQCPHLQYIKDIVTKKGYRLVEGSYISKGAERKREAGEYKNY